MLYMATEEHLLLRLVMTIAQNLGFCLSKAVSLTLLAASGNAKVHTSKPPLNRLIIRCVKTLNYPPDEVAPLDHPVFLKKVIHPALDSAYTLSRVYNCSGDEISNSLLTII